MKEMLKEYAFFSFLLLSTATSRSIINLSIHSSALDSSRKSSDLVTMPEPKRGVRELVSHFERIFVAAEDTRIAPPQAGVALPGMSRNLQSCPVLSIITDLPLSTTTRSAPADQPYSSNTGDGHPDLMARSQSSFDLAVAAGLIEQDVSDSSEHTRSTIYTPSSPWLWVCEDYTESPEEYDFDGMESRASQIYRAMLRPRVPVFPAQLAPLPAANTTPDATSDSSSSNGGVQLPDSDSSSGGVSLSQDPTRSSRSSSSDDLLNRPDLDTVFSTYMRLPSQPDDVDKPPEPKPDI